MVMTFIIVFVTLYGLGLGACQLFALLFGGTEGSYMRKVGYFPVLNVITMFVTIAFVFYIVRDYRKNNKTKSETVDSSNG